DEDSKSLIVSGKGASFGQAEGEVKLVEELLKSDSPSTSKTVLVVKAYKPEYQKLVSQSGAVVTEEGGLASDIAILAREKGVPLVVDADNASKMLKSGDIVRVDGSFGSVYLVSPVKGSEEIVAAEISKRRKEFVEAKSEKALSGDNSDGKSSDEDSADTEGVKKSQKDTADKGKTETVKQSGKTQSEEPSGSSGSYHQGISREEIEKIAKTRDFKNLVDKAVDKKVADELEKTPTPPKTGAFSDLDQLVGIKKEIQEHYEEKLDHDYAEKAAKKTLSGDKKQEDVSDGKMLESNQEPPGHGHEDEDTSGLDDVSDMVLATKVMINPVSTEVKRLEKALCNSDGAAYIDLDDIIIANKEHPLSSVDDGNFVDYANEIAKSVDDLAEILGADEAIVSVGSASQRDFAKLVRGRKYENPEVPGKLSGINRYMQSPETLRRILKIVRRIRNTFKSRNVSLGVHSPMNGELMKEVKKEILAAGLHRTGTFNIYAILDKSSEIIVARDIMASEIDGVIVNTPAIAREMLGVGKSAKLEDYGGSLSSQSVVKIINEVVQSVRESQGRVIVICGDDSDLIEACVSAGVYGISVKPSFVVEAKKMVRDCETQLISGL
ncbi:hypothetical protein GF357_04965, partial [Candidatus Dojkabacteria bacterium]|nr:hypothetical protein [Candidatus Dojkabacteria bacterium]